MQNSPYLDEKVGAFYVGRFHVRRNNHGYSRYHRNIRRVRSNSLFVFGWHDRLHVRIKIYLRRSHSSLLAQEWHRERRAEGKFKFITSTKIKSGSAIDFARTNYPIKQASPSATGGVVGAVRLMDRAAKACAQAGPACQTEGSCPRVVTQEISENMKMTFSFLCFPPRVHG